MTRKKPILYDWGILNYKMTIVSLKLDIFILKFGQNRAKIELSEVALIFECQDLILHGYLRKDMAREKNFKFSQKFKKFEFDIYKTKFHLRTKN